ncbi:MAG TPA: hypothetical protein DIU00_12795 [Phycisphaerales bacterium]|nr:hypothetical protein [Phycisphaerales bacterium]
MNSSDYLPNAFELGQDSGSRFNIEKYLERTGESIAWWKPLILQKRQYAQKIIESLGPAWSRTIDICIGEIRDDWMGVYFVYNHG